MGKQWKQCQTLFLGGSKITADGGCSHEIKRRLLLGKKVMTNLDSILKSRDITLPTKVHLVKAMFFHWSCMDVKVGLWRKLSAEELMLLNCGVGEDSWVYLKDIGRLFESGVVWLYKENEIIVYVPWESWKRIWSWFWAQVERFTSLHGKLMGKQW